MQKQIEVKIPEIPNRIQVGRESLQIGEFTVAELEEIGSLWTKKLIDEKKKNPIKKEGFLSHVERPNAS